MNIKIKRAIVVLLFVTFCAISDTAYAQNGEKSRETLPTTTKTVRQGGWAIPKARFVRGRSRRSTHVFDGIETTRTSLIPYVKVIDFEDYFIGSNGEVLIFPDKRTVEWVTAVSVKGKIFAYEVCYSPYVNGQPTTGALIVTQYVDADGDGLFEERFFSTRLKNVPQWIKK